ncbi:MAG: rRNA maturation RNase YbeY [Alphaproteobacteria bacterium]|nr:rRNA maturation RNase YbeY [Alphaproteobacteria bacterium]
MPTIETDITIACSKWSKKTEDLAKKTLETALKELNTGIQHIEISLLLTDDAHVQALNRDYRGKDKPTNVLSFPQFTPEELQNEKDFVPLGDIIIAYETIEREAKEQGKSLEDHTTHMLIHSLLHLLGHDHIEDKDAQKMEALEISILQKIGIKNPYETTENMA